MDRPHRAASAESIAAWEARRYPRFAALAAGPTTNLADTLPADPRDDPALVRAILNS